MPLFLESCGRNPCADFFLFTDLPAPGPLPANVRIIPVRYAEMEALIQKKIEPRFQLNTPYKLCDLKPAYGLLFEEHLAPYQFWGYCDIDLVFGDLNLVIDRRILDGCDFFTADAVLFVGHFTLVRNTPSVNRAFLEIEGFKENLCRFGWKLGNNDEEGMAKLAASHPEYRVSRPAGMEHAGVSLELNGRVVGAHERLTGYCRDGRTFVAGPSVAEREVLYLHFIALKRDYHWARYDSGKAYPAYSFGPSGFRPWISAPNPGLEFFRDEFYRALGAIRLWIAGHTPDKARVLIKRWLKI